MRFIPTSLLASTVLALSAVAHAETVDFTYTPTGATAITFSIDSTNIYNFDLGQDLTYNDISLSNGDTAQIDFVNPSFGTAVGDGPVDLLFADVTTQTSTLYTGVQLYTGPESAPTFTNGLYSLLADPGAGSSATGTLLITDVPTPPITPTPEPSSLLLLATGALSAAATARRRLFPSLKP